MGPEPLYLGQAASGPNLIELELETISEPFMFLTSRTVHY